MPDEAGVHGLLALMLINDARRDARFADGGVILLRDQDRSLWDLDQIADGRTALERALALGGRDPYVVQAALAALHSEEPQDWPQIAALYGELSRLTGSPVVELNRAAAIAEAGDAEAALAQVERLGLDSYHYLHSTARRCCAGSIASRTLAWPTAARSSSSTPTPSSASSSGGWPSSGATPSPTTASTGRRSRAG